MTTTSGWSYKELVKTYFHHSELQMEWALELISRSLFSGDAKILDFGSGDGKITALLSKLAPQGSATGVEISDEMVKFARGKFPKYAYENLSFEFEIPKDQSFDVVTSFSVFHLVPNPVEIFRQIKGQLTAQGKLLLSVPMNGNPYILQAALEASKKYSFKIPAYQPPADHFTMHTIEGCKAILSEAGFTNIRMDLVTYPTVFIDKDDFVQWMVGTLSAIWNVPWEFSHAFFVDVAENLMQLDPAMVKEENTIHFPSGRLHIIASQ